MRISEVGGFVKEYVRTLKSEKLRNIVKIQDEMLTLIRDFLRQKGFVELLPVVISPLTDPLNHDVYSATFESYGTKYSLTQSMIFHKQLALFNQEKIFIISPNVRLEPEERASLKRYLIEFVQVDLEMKDATREDIMEIIEELLAHVVSNLKVKFKDILEKMNPSLKIPKRPFEKIKYLDGLEKYGKDFEKILSENAENPFWLIDIPIDVREFYDKLSDDGKTLLDMDLIYPFGFGEALSGGEREHEYERILKRMKYKKNDPEDFRWYLEIAKEFGLPRSAGCGFGVERLTRYVCGLDHIRESRLFAKVPGEFGL